jgi:uracil-DNA glycosylase family 4
MDTLALLRLQIEWGADEALSETPVDRLRPASQPGSTGAPALREAGRPATPGSAPPASITDLRARPAVTAEPRISEQSRTTPAERALAAADQADTLSALRDAVAAFDGCALRDTASNLVFADGDPAGRLLLIGEPPGAEEDRSGQPFAGHEGQLLDKMLASIGLERGGLLLAPLIPWRPPGGRPPSAGEIAACLPFLQRLIALAAPRHVVLFGTLTARTLLPGRRRVGGWAELSGAWGTLPVVALPGLGAMLKTPALRRDAWAGLRLLRRALDGAATGVG